MKNAFSVRKNCFCKCAVVINYYLSFLLYIYKSFSGHYSLKEYHKICISFSQISWIRCNVTLPLISLTLFLFLPKKIKISIPFGIRVRDTKICPYSLTICQFRQVAKLDKNIIQANIIIPVASVNTFTNWDLLSLLQEHFCLNGY